MRNTSYVPEWNLGTQPRMECNMFLTVLGTCQIYLILIQIPKYWAQRREDVRKGGNVGTEMLPDLHCARITAV